MIKEFAKTMFDGFLTLSIVCLIVGGAVGGFLSLIYLVQTFPYITITAFLLIVIYCLGRQSNGHSDTK